MALRFCVHYYTRTFVILLAFQWVVIIEQTLRKDHAILEQRKEVYAAARTRNPARWSGAIRNWDRIENVW
ncbi:hypothetical protein, partial [Thiolapillus sp.]